jgi:peptide/nickel transport system ATP-binding protein
MCDRVAVMHRGKIVEIGDTEAICNDPQHSYTQSLISAVPKPDPRLRGSIKRVRYEPEGALV